MAAAQFFLPYQIAVKPTNIGAPGAKAYFYASGTTTLRPVYATDALSTQLANPVVADGAGRFPDIYLDNTLTYRLYLTDKAGALIDDIDPYIPGTAVKGDPGGNIMAIGLFGDADTLTIAAGTDLVRTSGYSTLGSGIADYVADAAVDAAYVAANPRSSFISANARGFRLAEHRPVTPHAFGAVGDGVTDDTAAVQAFWDFVIANNSPHDCSGVFGISDINADGKGLIIGPSVVPAVVPSQPLYGRMRLVALGQVNELVRIRNLTYRRWHGGIYAVGIGSASFASRTCLIGTYFENCARLHITDGVFGDNFALANVYCGTANNNMMKLGGVHGSNIGSGQVGNSLTANWSAPANTGSSGSTGQRTVIHLDAFPSAAIQSYETIGTFPVQVRIAGYLYYVFAVDQVAGTATVYPWLDNTSFAAGSGTLEWVFGGNFCTRSSDGNLIEVERLDASSVGRNLSEAVSYGSIIRDMQTNGAGTEICIGASPSNAAAGTLVLGRYNEGGAASSEQVVHLARFGNSNFHLMLGDAGAPDLSKCWATGDPRATAGNIVGGEFGSQSLGSISISKFGRILSQLKNNLSRGLGSTLSLQGQSRPPYPEIYSRDSHNLTLNVLGTGEYNRLFGYSGGLLGYVGTGTNGAPTGSFVFTPPAGGTINGGAVNATVTFSGFDGPVLFSYEHTDTAQLTWLVRPLTGQSRSNTTALGYSTGAGGTVAQATSKATGVTLSKLSGQITMNAAALAASTSVGFTLTNTLIAATDTIIVNIASGGTVASYTATVDAVAAGSCKIHLRNVSAGSLSEAIVLNFAVLKAVAA
jgi:hypothetical protein